MSMTVGEARAIVSRIDGSLNDHAALKNKVETNFKELDVDNSGHLDHMEAKKLVDQLHMMMNLPLVSEDEYQQHFKTLDADGNGFLSVTEMGSGIVGAMQFKKATMEHYLTFATRDNLSDSDALPLQ